MDPMDYDGIIEIECGRQKDGTFCYQVPLWTEESMPPTAVWFIDSHGNPTLHKRLAPAYDHVFYAVHSKRDLFEKHPSAHWCPNATDIKWFGRSQFQSTNPSPKYDFGFFGSKMGLARADQMKAICEANGWSYDIRQVNGVYKHRWPHTGEAMARCKVLFNMGQKHDGPNQRVMESMAVGRPLLNDLDDEDGMNMIFENGVHFLGYTPDTLETTMKYAMVADHTEMVRAAYNEVAHKHTIFQRAKKIVEVLNA